VIHRVRLILLAMRPSHWVKNLFVFAGLIFSKNLFDTALLMEVSLGFVLFSLASSSVYLFNDIRDISYDRNHPQKNKRPIASGKLRTSEAYIAFVSLALVSLGAGFILDRLFSLILLTYICVNVAYSIKLKQVVIIDIMIIALGFVLRVLGGTILVRVSPSDWLIICTMAISLFLGFSKRRQELVLAEANSTKQRQVLQQYSLPFLDQMIAVVTGCTVISYALYTVSPETVTRFGTRNLVLSLPFVLYGIFRYLYLVYLRPSGENPTEVIVKDVPFLANLGLWFVVVLIVVY
jgi:4-hydroxybenzoate polyprenyltransferase